MANKAISELPQAQNVNNQDLFVLEQSGIAKKLPAETFITEQGIINALAEALDGHGGIQSVTLASVSGRIRTYRITFSDGSATTFQVYDGTSIDRISRTSSSGLQDTYTIFMSDGTTTFFTVTNGADGTVSEAMLNDALKDKAPVITETTESSAIANFTDGADDMVMHNVVAEINPVQDLSNGDPSPTNICPITGWTGCNVTRAGKNLFDKANGAKNLYVGGGNVTGTGGTLLCFLAKKETQYTINMTGGNRTNLYYYDTTSLNDIVSGITLNVVTLSAAKPYTFIADHDAVYCYYADSNFQQAVADSCMVELGSTATTYETYQGTTLTVDWTTEAGTVYGGTIDVATGLLTVDRVINERLLSTFYSLGDSTNTTHYRYVDEFFPSGTGRAVADSTAICNIAPYAYNSTDTTHFYLSWITQYNTNRIELWVPKGTATTTPVQICAKLREPLTYQLTPQQLMTLLGTNNVWADTGNVSVTYPADTKMFIEKLTMPTEDDLVANQAITSGKYFMIGNSLYLALANIASGAQITIGTNAQRVSLADALNTINS